MQTSESMALMKAWEERGNPPCDHPQLDKEYYLGSATGDYVCTTCGEQRPGSGWGGQSS
jgi:hypothetical protein